MKTGRKISLIYSGITIGLIIIAGVVFYFLPQTMCTVFTSIIWKRKHMP